MIMHSLLLNNTLQPALLNFVTDIRELFFMPGSSYAICAFCGSCANFRLQMCEDYRVVPSGIVTLIGVWLICLLVMGAS